MLNLVTQGYLQHGFPAPNRNQHQARRREQRPCSNDWPHWTVCCGVLRTFPNTSSVRNSNGRHTSAGRPSLMIWPPFRRWCFLARSTILAIDSCRLAGDPKLQRCVACSVCIRYRILKPSRLIRGWDPRAAVVELVVGVGSTRTATFRIHSRLWDPSITHHRPGSDKARHSHSPPAGCGCSGTAR